MIEARMIETQMIKARMIEVRIIREVHGTQRDDSTRDYIYDNNCKKQRKVKTFNLLNRSF